MPRPLDVTTTLADFAIVTFSVDPERLGALLPPQIEPDVFTLRDGRRVALVSAVPFRDLDFRFAFAPWARFGFGQTNYRAYVSFRGTRCVWFFGTSLATPLVAIPKYAWKLPWHHASMAFDTAWSGQACDRYAFTARSAWANADLELHDTGQPCGTLDGFDDDETTRLILTHPFDGYFYRRDGRVGHYAVWHDALHMRRADAAKAYFSVFEELGLTIAGQVPHSALITRRTEFEIYLPPRVVS